MPASLQARLTLATSQICDTTAELAAVIVDENGWPELLPFIFQCVQSQNPREVESALLIFAQLAHYLMGTLKQYMGTLNDVLRSCLQSPVLDVAIAAMRATTAFIQELDDGSERNKFQVRSLLHWRACVKNLKSKECACSSFGNCFQSSLVPAAGSASSFVLPTDNIAPACKVKYHPPYLLNHPSVV